MPMEASASAAPAPVAPSATDSLPGLSVAIIAKDEGENLPATLRSVAWADQLIVVDSGSTDDTEAIANAFHATFVRQEWLGFSEQKNYAISLCTHDWVLSLDADESVSLELAAAIRKTLGSSRPVSQDAYSMNRRNYFLGRWIRYGGFYPDSKVRLFRRGFARFGDRAVHESISSTGPQQLLHGDLIHNAYPTLAQYIEHMNRYSSLAAIEAISQSRRANFLRDVLLRPAATFIHKYIIRGGFRDGAEGLLLNLFHAYYVSSKYAKIWDGSRRVVKEGSHF